MEQFVCSAWFGDVGLGVIVDSDKVNDWRWTPNPEAIEADRQRLDGVAPFDPVGRQVSLSLGCIARENLKPDLRAGNVLTAVEPQVAAAELKDVVGEMAFKQRQAKCIAVEGERRFKYGGRQLDGNVGTTVELRRIHIDDGSSNTLAESPN
jgi:hypothetical protein